MIDASVTLSWCFPDEETAHSKSVLKALATGEALVPELWAFEVANALVVAQRRRRVTAELAEEFLTKLAKLPIRVVPQEPGVILRQLPVLAQRHGLTAYDAAYLLLAHGRAVPLATLDGDLKKAARAVGVEIIEPPADALRTESPD